MKFRSWHVRIAFAIAAALCAFSANGQYFTNGISKGADPGVMFYKGYFYGTHTGAYKKASGLGGASTGTVTLYKSAQLPTLFTSAEKVEIPVTVGPRNKGIWAPYVFEYRGSVYMYYFDAGSGRSHIAKTKSTNPDPADPMGAWEDHSEVVLLGYDWVALQRADKNELWGFYSQGGKLWARLMDDPLTPHPGLRPAAIAYTTAQPADPKEYRQWENLDDRPGLTEAPEPFQLTVNGKLIQYLTYSSNHYAGDNYALGLLQYANNDGSDRMDHIANWTKITSNTVPFLSSGKDDGHGNVIVSTGSDAMVKDGNGVLWNFYHAKFHSSETNTRELRVERVKLNADGSPSIPQPSPAPEGKLLPLPGGAATRLDYFLPAGTYVYSDKRLFLSHPGANQPKWRTAPSRKWVENGGPDSYSMMRFYGKSIAVYAPKGENMGIASFFADADWKADVDLYAAGGATVGGTPVYVFNFTTAGEHTLLMMAKGTKNPAASAMTIGIARFVIGN